MTRIDRIFKQYAVDFFGETPTERLTEEQIEEARVFAFSELHKLTEKYGRQKDGTCREIFLNYLFDRYI